MDQDKLIEIVDAAYPDGLVARCYEEPFCDHGDTLARFITNEICDTFDEKATDKEQIEEALRVVFNARRELDAVCDALKMVRFTKTGKAMR